MFSFGCPTPIVSPELTEKLSCPTTQVSDIVSDPSTPRALRANHLPVVNYLASHIQEIFDLALNVTEENHQTSGKAFSLLTIANDKIFEVILNKEHNLMKENAMEVMKSKDMIKLNRMAMVIQNCFLQPSLELVEDCEYLLDLIKYMNNRSVYDLFLSLVGVNDSEQKIMKEYLTEHDFIKKLFQAIDELVVDGVVKENQEDDNNELLLINMLKLVVALKNSDLMFEQIGINELNILLKDIPNASVILLNSKWNAINTIVESNELTQEIANRFNELGLLSMIEKDGDFMLYQEYVLILISKVANKIDEIAEMLLNIDIGSKLAEIVYKHPKHSNVHIAMVNFCKNVKSRTQLSNNVINALFKVAVKLIENNPGVEELSFGWNLTRTIRELDEDFDVSSVLTENINNKFEEMDNIYNETYGGEVPSSEEISITPEQLQVLLRFIAGSR